LLQSHLLECPGQSDDCDVSSIVRRTLVARALVPRRDAVPPPRVLTLDADTAVMLAVDATRGMLDACLRKPDPAPSSVASQPAPASDVPEAPSYTLAPESAEACPPWRVRQAKRAYQSTLPPPPDDAAPRRGCNRWA
jgi:hypothetical protein